MRDFLLQVYFVFPTHVGVNLPRSPGRLRAGSPPHTREGEPCPDLLGTALTGGEN